MIDELGYRPYRPSGYTDDLGIIADRNQWVKEQIPGWYFRIPGNRKPSVRSWLEENKVLYYEEDWALVIHRRSDAVLFRMVWDEQPAA